MRGFLSLVDEDQLSLAELAPITSPHFLPKRKTKRRKKNENKEAKTLKSSLIGTPPNSPTKINEPLPLPPTPWFLAPEEKKKTAIR